MNGKLVCLILAAVTLLILGCSLPTITISSGSTPTVVPAEPTTVDVAPTTVPPEPTATVQPTEVKPTETPEPSATPTVAHFVYPVEPTGKYQTIHDQISEKVAPQKRAYGGDEYDVGRYERSFTAEMDYQPFIDIEKAELNRVDPLWVFVRIQVISDPLNSGEADPLFGVELDVDANNRGEYLILASPPHEKGWTTDQVQVWQDLDADVGGNKPVRNDISEGDGYETLVFDQGQGNDPDLVWVRISPLGPNYVEIAFKNDLTGGEDAKFIWLPWALSGIKDHSIYEYNDHFTLAMAGSPLKEDQVNYPLKELWGVDNTCRGTSGMVPQPSMIGACANYEPPPSRPGATNVPPPPNPVIPIIK